MTLLSLAVEVLDKGSGSEDGLQVAEQLQSLTRGGTSGGTAGSQSGCEDGHWIQAVMSGGEIVKLEDGSIWEIDSIDVIDSALWLPIEEIIICGNTIINSDSGDKVSAKRLK